MSPKVLAHSSLMAALATVILAIVGSDNRLIVSVWFVGLILGCTSFERAMHAKMDIRIAGIALLSSALLLVICAALVTYWPS